MNKKNKPKVRTQVEIKTHQRKVEGGPSQEVIDYAKKHNIDLKEGHTLVRQHKRNMDKNQETEDISKESEEIDSLINLNWTTSKGIE